MSFKQKFISAVASAFAVAAFTTFVAAQDTTTTTTTPNDSIQKPDKFGRGFRKDGFRRDGMRGGKHGGGDKMMMRSLGKLNLSDAQKEQTRSIFENLKNSTQPQREELRSLGMKKRDGVITADEQARAKELRMQLKTSGDQAHNSVLTILTAEQRTQLDQMHQEMKQKMMERRQNRQNQQSVPQSQDN